MKINLTKEYVSDALNLAVKGHKNFDFVDVNHFDDQALFIDPCLIEIAKDPLCRKAQAAIDSFFDEFFHAYREGDYSRKQYLLSHAGEINATRLGYGNGHNGHGNTAVGLIEKFAALDSLSQKIRGFSKAMDLPVFVPDFDKDGLSDMLTNIIHRELNDFTLNQLEKWGVAPNDKYMFWTWDSMTGSWKEVESECYKTSTGVLLLVPKHVVRHRYICNVEQYFSRVVLERMQQERASYDEKGKLHMPYKKDIAAEIVKLDDNWKYDYAVDYSAKYPDALPEYHGRVREFYSGFQMTDEELDERIYR